ncbi:TetR/AcrR family transcriptional regulator [Nocardia altamirensis]|uniref:TetR/AcrR family transcriptional regulator n=1 Tax=Nocardia altamirensis TaxID=472158 RepID=UPI0009FCB030|nr:TetR/AcrR family transcriptional regulator [Nocardia altamirensis]
MGRPVDPELAVRRRAALVAAAYQVFGEVGYHAAGITEITKRAGLGRGTFYIYFESKRAMLDAVFDDVFARLLDTVVDVVGSTPMTSWADAERRLRAITERMFALFDENPGMTTIFARDGLIDQEISARVFGMLSALELSMVSTFEEAVRTGVVHRDIDPEFAAIAMVGLPLGVLQHELREPMSAPRRTALVDFMINTLGASLRPTR